MHTSDNDLHRLAIKERLLKFSSDITTQFINMLLSKYMRELAT